MTDLSPEAVNRALFAEALRAIEEKAMKAMATQREVLRDVKMSDTVRLHATIPVASVIGECRRQRARLLGGVGPTPAQIEKRYLAMGEQQRSGWLVVIPGGAGCLCGAPATTSASQGGGPGHDVCERCWRMDFRDNGDARESE